MEIGEIAKDIRKKIYQIAHFAGGGHMGAAFSMADIISVLYFDGVLKYDAGNPEWEERDKFILSKGTQAMHYMQCLQKQVFSQRRNYGTWESRDQGLAAIPKCMTYQG